MGQRKGSFRTILINRDTHTMKTFWKSGLAAFLLIGISGVALGQTRTVETTSITDSTSGETQTTTVVKVGYSEDITPRRQMVFIDPFKFFAMFNASYLYALDSKVAVGGGIQTPTALMDGDGLTEKVTGFGLNIEGRYYPTAKMFRGFHFVGNISYNHISYQDFSDATLTQQEQTSNPITIGTGLGWHWYPWDECAVEFVFGADLQMGPTTTPIPGLSLYSDKAGVVPWGRCNIGYAW